jgi:hypothetical protein
MINRTLRRTAMADQSVAHGCQIICAVLAGLVMVCGIRRLAGMDLNEGQLFSALAGTLLLSGLFIVLGFQCRAWRRAVNNLPSVAVPGS